MSNSRQELESQNEIVIGLQAIAKQSKELMRQLRRPTGDKNLYNSLGQDIQRAEKKVKHLRQQENDIDAFQKTNQSLAETNKLLAASRKNPPRWQC